MIKFLENEQKRKEITKFICDVAHELKAPMMTFNSFLSFLKEDLKTGDTENINKSLLHLEDAAVKMTTLIQDFIALSYSNTTNSNTTKTDAELIESILGNNSNTTNVEEASILLVEDDRAIREAVCRILKKSGYLVATASDGIDALEYLRNNPAPSLILLDYRMPRMDGEVFRREQLKDSIFSLIPTILISAVSLMPDVLESLKLNIVVEKPFQIHSFLQIVGSFFNHEESSKDCH